MHTEHQQRNFSFELFPPKTEKGLENLKQNVAELNTKQPAYFSVTYGAGGSTRQRTFDTVEWLMDEQITTAPHLSCIGANRDEILEILEHYKSIGIRRLVALRGDLPSGTGLGELGDLNHANQLVELIQETYPRLFHIEVAAYPEFHPQASSPEQDLIYFKRKIEAGADSAITQYFYNADAYFRFLDNCQKLQIDIPIVPGIMPITNFTQLARFSDACGTEIPRWLRKRLEGFGDDLEAIRSYGTETVIRLCERLLEGGAPGLHFYTMNQAKPTLAIWQALSL
ncbi:MAG: methylenetetrahydrofolate reductase [NAD(P)H] [Candidatus Thiodiazotropha sp. (ex Lucina aurantia)]|uniref:Methylenetetrahydrofolate reductase n=2 Tax=Candidatus Thiodiazotropha TaxID=1913444 RepID=A0A7Z1AGZ7_9GAMM|nr:methylenetetrahydrofolate reductase [NAD(P)H] [Candidatus Thiodiazotropha endolucinida]MBT3012732.1 methylenetetrahydrofolate reductase [NAD(P)H] [Candidatus Thiodiazotropha sp. (ex Lucina pensylvanica)]MBT3014821.1 methylenetetrahydrofolate reductase [NAD(P)H] [Candidatus Thiodiazotropha taylori]MBT3039630.1 methylenetetrahydrofolate reductase [NAD(P)H] [Candidatus Thiodiazotropha sp. (ex Codakia orbicularis)]MBV2103702.1 methylenetetrahydrofolate reductase [NAD(P)H] [Candidatus Thiodiazotr